MKRRHTLDTLLTDNSLEAVWFARPNAFSWLTGSDNVITVTDPVGVAAAGYDGDSMEIVTANNEADRIREELPETTVRSYEWHESTLAEAVAERSPTPAAADFDVSGFDSIDISPYRQPLTDDDIEQYRALGAETATVVEEVCRSLSTDTSERTVTARLKRAFEERGITVPVALVGGAERVQRHRHFTPTDAAVGAYAIVTLCTVRAGLCISITRTVAFDPPAWLSDRHHAAARVHATALAATRDVGLRGGTASEVFGAIQDAYAAVGYPDEWRLHHQGGAGGYATREWIATPDSDAPVTLPMGYAWNPTVQGAKCEDTVIVTDDGFETLTRTGEWPTTSTDAVGFDLSLPQHDVLVQ
ncbi:M24 family metallopeptidase [Halocatena pleomorpha]|uniref:M24 family metallopeptidase n=1 Tax=Halocatena pleomorpha TaxID=1785090 RepID=A0A3P3RJF7_9EURY|nr:M24 family metallopeptidase [Halocatena pleomorpha]RRJ33666.1 M24 family metallopeptidase [Halocatena pleomorpha]